MIKYLVIAGFTMMLSGIAGAHKAPLVNIEKAHKVTIKGGVSHHHKMMMMKCMLLIKKYKTADEAVEAKMAKIHEKCESHKIHKDKCKRIKHMVAKKIWHCFTARDFIKEFFKGQASE